MTKILAGDNGFIGFACYRILNHATLVNTGMASEGEIKCKPIVRDEGDRFTCDNMHIGLGNATYDARVAVKFSFNFMKSHDKKFRMIYLESLFKSMTEVVDKAYCDTPNKL